MCILKNVEQLCPLIFWFAIVKLYMNLFVHKFEKTLYICMRNNCHSLLVTEHLTIFDFHYKDVENYGRYKTVSNKTLYLCQIITKKIRKRKILRIKNSYHDLTIVNTSSVLTMASAGSLRHHNVNPKIFNETTLF